MPPLPAIERAFWFVVSFKDPVYIEALLVYNWRMNQESLWVIVVMVFIFLLVYIAYLSTRLRRREYDLVLANEKATSLTENYDALCRARKT
jgi:hypothetical protein